MNLLALDFSTEQRSVCVSPDDGIDAVVSSTDRSAGPLALIASALQTAGRQRDEIGVVAVGLGPGSYTGIRSSIAIAQGFELGRNVQLCGVSSADIIAHSATVIGEFAVIIDAQRGDFYCATYRRTEVGVESNLDLRILSPEEMSRLEMPVVGPQVEGLLGRGTNVLPDPRKLAQLARANPCFVSGHELKPIYLRPVEFKKAPPPRPIN